MNRPLLIGITAAVIVAAVFVAGYWPQHRRAAEAQTQVHALQQQLADAQGRVRLGEILGQLLRLSDAVAARNFGVAAQDATAYFDRVRDESVRSQASGVKQALERILQTRDRVTTLLARTDPSVADVLRQHEQMLRQALGYPLASDGRTADASR